MGAYKSKTNTVEYFNNNKLRMTLINDELIAYSYNGTSTVTSDKIRKNGYLSFLADSLTTWIIVSDPNNIPTADEGEYEIPEKPAVEKPIDFNPPRVS